MFVPPGSGQGMLLKRKYARACHRWHAVYVVVSHVEAMHCSLLWAGWHGWAESVQGGNGAMTRPGTCFLRCSASARTSRLLTSRANNMALATPVLSRTSAFPRADAGSCNLANVNRDENAK